jgi:uncharacterized membrane protein
MKGQFYFAEFEQVISRTVRAEGKPQRIVDPAVENRREVQKAGEHRHNRDEQRILEYLERQSATRHELSVALQMAYTTVSARVSDLKRKGFVEDTKEKRPTPTGSPACVLRIAG